MRPLTTLLLGGLLHACGASPGQAGNAPDTGVPPVPAVPSRIAAGPSVLFAAGTFALVKDYDYPYSLGATYVARPRTRWRLAPGAGFALGPDGIAFVYLDVRRDFALGRHWYVTPSLASGWFLNGDEIGTGSHLQFQSGIMFAREFDNGLRLGLAGLHISNGGLEEPNNGTEALLLTLQIPF